MEINNFFGNQSKFVPNENIKSNNPNLLKDMEEKEKILNESFSKYNKDLKIQPEHENISGIKNEDLKRVEINNMINIIRMKNLMLKELMPNFTREEVKNFVDKKLDGMRHQHITPSPKAHFSDMYKEDHFKK